MRKYIFVLAAAMLGSRAFAAEPAPTFDAAAAFGQRAGVSSMRISPDGLRVVYITPKGSRGSQVVTVGLAPDSRPAVTLTSDGDQERVDDCNWVSNERLVCVVYGITSIATRLMPFTRLVAVNLDGTNPRVLSKRATPYTRGVVLAGGSVIDWLPEQQGNVLMDRFSLPDDHVGSRIGSAEIGLGVDWLDTRTMETKTVEHPARNATRYITDGHGAIRVMAVGTRRAGQQTSTVDYLYRRKGASGWEPLASYDSLSRTGFEPVAVDRDLDVAYGFMKKDGRRALYSIALDGSLKEAVAFARDDVDVDRLLRIGRHGRVVGASYATTYRSAFYFDPAIERLVTSLASALPTHPGIRIVDSNVDESQLLVHASRDDDPGVYYIFDRAAKHLQTFLVVRPALEGVKLANERPITYRATDGTEVPGYLTLPYGQPDPKGIPAIVMPHGGPSARDEWGFNWLAQYFAARGFAVLQPNYRGSSGYGDTWFQRNGFKSWPTAISDVLDGGRWLVSSGLADPAKLAIVGWSYGGYAALQSGVVDASVFKAIVAIAPVTDLDAMKEQHRRDGNFALMNEIIGGGALARDGSPALNAKKITVPVLMFHGTIDINVPYAQSVEMMDALGPGNHQLVTYDDLDHQLDDSVVRADLLGKSDAFLRQTLGLH